MNVLTGSGPCELPSSLSLLKKIRGIQASPFISHSNNLSKGLNGTRDYWGFKALLSFSSRMKLNTIICWVRWTQMGSQLQPFITAVTLCDLGWQGSGLTKILCVCQMFGTQNWPLRAVVMLVSPCFPIFKMQNGVTIFSLWYLEETLMRSCFDESNFSSVKKKWNRRLKCCCECSKRIVVQARRMFALLTDLAFYGFDVF